MVCYVQINSHNKAKNDIDILMQQRGYRNITIRGLGKGHLETFGRKFFSAFSILFRIGKGDVLFLQYPFKKFFHIYCLLAHLKGAQTVTLIHDLGSFRRKKLTVAKEMKRLSATDYIIAHNDRMRSWMQLQGCSCPIGCLDIFDYLSDASASSCLHQSPYCNIAFAGGLSERKSSFLYAAGNTLAGCHLDLFGKNNFSGNDFGSNLEFHGQIPSDAFIENNPDDWGLVWDGEAVDGCSGTWGNYLRYNNPHKTSFYLRAGLPVIVWDESAMAPFIQRHHLGLTVARLGQIPALLAEMSNADYSTMIDNVQTVSHQLQEGFYFYQALDDALQSLIQQQSH